MLHIEWVALGLGAFLLALLATRLVVTFASRFRLVDHPTLRSSHIRPTPRGGGLGMVISFLLAVLVMHALGALKAPLSAALLLGGGAIALVGLIDDRRSLSAKVRIVVHLMSAAAAVFFVGMPSYLLGDRNVLAEWGIRVIGILAITWAVNLFNFMDGIDGIAASEAIFIGAASGALNGYLSGDPGLSVAMWVVASASAGFLVWNWPPARIFMGDVGSGFLGFTLATLSLALSRDHPAGIAISAILSGTFIADATVTLVRRIVRGDRWSEGHRTHAYQHLAQRWHAHRPVILAVGAINLLWLLPWAIAVAVRPGQAAIFAFAALGPLVILAVLCGAGVQKK